MGYPMGGEPVERRYPTSLESRKKKVGSKYDGSVITLWPVLDWVLLYSCVCALTHTSFANPAEFDDKCKSSQTIST